MKPKAKPAELDLSQLVGHTVSAFWNGWRTGKVVAVSAHTVTVRFLPPIGRHRVALGSVAGVFWAEQRRSKRAVPLGEFLERRAKARAVQS